MCPCPCGLLGCAWASAADRVPKHRAGPSRVPGPASRDGFMSPTDMRSHQETRVRSSQNSFPVQQGQSENCTRVSFPQRVPGPTRPLSVSAAPRRPAVAATRARLRALPWRKVTSGRPETRKSRHRPWATPRRIHDKTCHLDTRYSRARCQPSLGRRVSGSSQRDFLLRKPLPHETPGLSPRPCSHPALRGCLGCLLRTQTPRATFGGPQRTAGPSGSSSPHQQLAGKLETKLQLVRSVGGQVRAADHAGRRPAPEPTDRFYSAPPSCPTLHSSCSARVDHSARPLSVTLPCPCVPLLQPCTSIRLLPRHLDAAHCCLALPASHQAQG